MASVLITGGSGLVGKNLCHKLDKQGFDIKILSRQKKSRLNYKSFYWNPDKREIEKEALEGTDYIIHLAGANLSSKRWSQKRKKEIIESRVGTTKLLFDYIAKNKIKPKAFISSSAVGFYGSITSDKIFEETDVAAKDFLGTTCSDWEKSADLFSQAGIRTVKIRTSLVLADEGPLVKIKLPIKLGFGSPLGDGSQYMPWVHIDDLVSIFILAIEDLKIEGAYNVAAPDHKTNKEFTERLTKVLKKPLWMPNVPGFVLKIALGEMADIVLNGSRVSSEKIIKAGYRFKFSLLEQALEDICKI